MYQLCRDHELEQLKESMDFHAHLAFLIDILDRGTFHEMPIIFILDEFHLFTSRAKQTLLYNLCDLLQSGKAQICIIGMTPHLDCYDRLEKRIRSRMSHRRILMGPQRAQRVGSDGSASDTRDNLKAEQQRRQEQLRQILRDRLYLPTATAAATTKTTTPVETSSAPATATQTDTVSTYVSAHNASIDLLLSPHASPRLHALLSFHSSLGRPVAFFHQVVRLALCASVGPRHTQLTEEDVVWAIEYHKKDWIREAIKSEMR